MEQAGGENGKIMTEGWAAKKQTSARVAAAAGERRTRDAGGRHPKVRMKRKRQPTKRTRTKVMRGKWWSQADRSIHNVKKAPWEKVRERSRAKKKIPMLKWMGTEEEGTEKAGETQTGRVGYY